MQAVYQKMGDALLQDRPADRLQPLPVRPQRRVEVGRQGRRQLVAHHRRHQRQLDDRMTDIGFGQFRPIASVSPAPGHWNDPDMLEIGNGGMTARRIPRPT